MDSSCWEHKTMTLRITNTILFWFKNIIDKLIYFNKKTFSVLTFNHWPDRFYDRSKQSLWFINILFFSCWHQVTFIQHVYAVQWMFYILTINDGITFFSLYPMEGRPSCCFSYHSWCSVGPLKSLSYFLTSLETAKIGILYSTHQPLLIS